MGGGLKYITADDKTKNETLIMVKELVNK